MSGRGHPGHVATSLAVEDLLALIELGERDAVVLVRVEIIEVDGFSHGGQATVADYGTLLYSPAPDFCSECVSPDSPETFSYTIRDANGDTSTAFSPSYEFTEDGSYTVSLTVSNEQDCDNTLIAPQQIEVLPVPIIDFDLDTLVGCAPLRVQVSNQTADATAYLWDFTDELLDSTSIEPNHIFDAAGIYALSLTANYQGLCFAEAPNELLVEVYEKPSANFDCLSIDTTNALGAFVNAGIYQFDNTSQGASAYLWTFGDGDSSTQINPLHRYDYSATFPILLYASNEYCSDTAYKELAVNLDGTLFLPNSMAIYTNDPNTNLFTPKGQGIALFELVIYDKWGNVIWTTDTNDLDENGAPTKSWDGRLPNGNFAPQEVYVWHVKKLLFVDGTTANEWSEPNQVESRTTLWGLVKDKDYEISKSGIGRMGTISIFR